MSYRVMQWATGGVGRAAIEGVLDHPELELVGCWVHSAAKDGMDVGELVGRPAVGVRASCDADALLATDADCVVYSPMMADPTVRRRSCAPGKNVVTPVGWFYPPGTTEWPALDAVCREAGVTLHGTGIHPGGITERFPLMISALCAADHPRARRGVLRHPHLRRTRRGARRHAVRQATPEQARAQHRWPTLLGDGFRQSVRMVADELGFAARPEIAHDPRDRGRDRTDRLPDRRDRARPGRGAALPLGGHWSTACRSSPPPSTGSWARSTSTRPGASGPRASASRSRSTGDPPVQLTFHGAAPRRRSRRACAATPASSRPRCTASTPIPTCARPSPGIKTYLDLPLVAGRAAARLPPEAGSPAMILDRFSLAGQVAIVTGAGRGIGRGIAHRRWPRPARDVVVAARTGADLDEVAGAVARARSPRARRAHRRHRPATSTRCVDAHARRVRPRSTSWSTTPAAIRRPRAAMTPTRSSWRRVPLQRHRRVPVARQLAARQMVDTAGARRDRQHLVAARRIVTQTASSPTARPRPRSTG